MKALFRVRKHGEVEAEGVTPQGAATDVVVPPDDYLDRLVKLIPAEAVTVYTAGHEIARSAGGLPEWALTCLGLTFVLRSLTTYTAANGVQWMTVLLTTMSFSIWVYALGNHFPGLVGVPSQLITLVILVWTTLIPYVYTGS